MSNIIDRRPFRVVEPPKAVWIDVEPIDYRRGIEPRDPAIETAMVAFVVYQLKKPERD